LTATFTVTLTPLLGAVLVFDAGSWPCLFLPLGSVLGAELVSEPGVSVVGLFDCELSDS
jgi:hypothetical protein